MLYTAGLALLLIVGGFVNRRTEPVLAWMAIALLAVGLMLVGRGVVGGGFGPGYLGVFACGLGVVIGTIFAIGFLRQTPS